MRAPPPLPASPCRICLHVPMAVVAWLCPPGHTCKSPHLQCLACLPALPWQPPACARRTADAVACVDVRYRAIVRYKSVPLPGVPFHEDANVINNWCGVVVDDEGEPVPGLYCSGWVKRGPSGIIGTNIPDSRETVASLIKDAQVSSHPPPHCA